MHRFRGRFVLLAVLLVASSMLGGCIVAGLASAMGRSAEYQKLIEVPARYPGLQDKSVAVIVQADLSIMYEHPDLVPQVMGGIASRINQHVPGVKLMPLQNLVAWQYITPQWNALPYGEIAKQLGVDRVVMVEIYEFRLHEPGNSWLWSGACVADIGIIERDGPDPDMYADMFQVESAFPEAKGIGRENATATQVELGVLVRFVRNAAWLFYDHREPKHPRYYDGELNE